MLFLGQSGLVAAYVLVALLLTTLHLYTRWSWKVKAALIVTVSTFYLVTYLSLPPLLGWPADETLPERFNLIAAHVQEPDKVTGAEGKIFLWATDMARSLREGEPRAYEVPFTRELHAKVMEARNKTRKGQAQLGEISEDPIGPDGRPQDGFRSGQRSVAIEFFDLPDPLFPEK